MNAPETQANAIDEQAKAQAHIENVLATRQQLIDVLKDKNPSPFIAVGAAFDLAMMLINLDAFDARARIVFADLMTAEAETLRQAATQIVSDATPGQFKVPDQTVQDLEAVQAETAAGALAIPAKCAANGDCAKCGTSCPGATPTIQ